MLTQTSPAPADGASVDSLPPGRPARRAAAPRSWRLGRMLVVVLAMVGFATVTGCTTDRQVISQADQVHNQLEPAVVTDPELASYVQQVGDRIVNTARDLHAQGHFSRADSWMFEDIKFHLVASPTLNAFTTGGNHVYLYSSLLEASESEDAFAAVVGHEFGHILGRHVQQSMDRQMGILAGAGLAGLIGAAAAPEGRRGETGMTVAGAAAGLGTLFGMGFGRDNEREADDLGFRVYVHAGYDPDRFPDFFKNMIARGYDTPGGLQQYLASHPRLAERVEAAERMAAEVPEEMRQRLARPPIANEREFERLKQRSSEFTRQAEAAAAQGAQTPFVEALQILDAFPACVGGPADGVEEPPPAQVSHRH